MRLKLNRTLRAALIAAITAVGLSISQAATYVWDGEAGDGKWSTPKNWNLNNGYYPQSNGDYAEITDGTSTVTWSNCSYLGATNTITLGNGNTVLFQPGQADLNVNTYNLQGNAQFLGSSTNAIGFGRDFAINYQDMTKDAHGLFEIQMTAGTLWRNDHKISLLGEFDTTGITEAGEFTIFDISNVQGTAGGGITLDISGLTYDDQNGVDVEFVKTNNNKVVVRYSVTAPVSSLIWVGAEGNNELTTAVWKDDQGKEASYSSTAPLIFNADGYKTVAITSDATAKSIEIQGYGYEFKLGDDSSLTTRTLTIAQGASLSITGTGTVTLSGALTKAGALSLAEGVSMTAASSSVDANGKFALAGGGHLTLSSLNMGSGSAQTLAVSDNSRLTVGGSYAVGSGKTLSIEGTGLVDLTTLKSTGGTINVSSNLNVTGGGTGQSGDNQKALAITGGTGTVNINAGTTTVTGAVYSGGGSKGTLNVGTAGQDAKLVATRLEFGDTDSGGSVSRINIGADGTVVVTSNNNDANVKTAGLAVAEWNQNTEISVAGKLYAQSTRIFAHDGLMTLNIENGGTVAVKGITADKAQNNVVTLAENGKLVLGDTGITSGNGTWNITLNGGEVGITADTTIARAINVAGDVTFYTAKYTWADSGATLNTGAGGGTMTVSGNLTGAGTIIKKGEGELILSGTGNALTHTLQIKEGKLTINGSIAIDGIEDGELVEGFVNASEEKSDHGNGFAYKSGLMNVYSLEGDAQLVNNGSFTINGVTVSVTDEGKYELEETVNKTTLYVNENSADFSAYKAKATDELTKVELANGTSVNMDYDGASISLAIHGDGTVNATKATTVTALTGTGKLIVDGTQKVTVQSTSGYIGGYSVDAGATLEFVTNNAPDSLTVEGTGALRLLTNQGGQNTNLKTVTASNLYLGADANHNSRFMVNGSTNLSGVGHLYFDGGQLWLDQASLTYNGAVTFNATTYSESGQPVLNGAAMRINNSAEFNGTVDVQANTKLAFATDGTVVTFGGAVTGSGQLELKSWNNKTGTFRVSGDASGYQGAILSDSLITLDVADGAALTVNSGSNINGAVTLNGALTVAGEGDSTISGVISGVGSLTKEGAGTLTLSGTNTYTGDTVVTGGTLDIQGSIANSTVKVAESAIIAGNTENISVGIASGKTATIAGEFTPKDSSVTFISDSGEVKVQNTGAAEITYGIDEVNAKVTADKLYYGIYSEAETDVTVKNEVVVGEILNFGKGALTLTRVATEPLQTIFAGDGAGAVTLQNVSEGSIELKELYLPGNTVAVYTDDTATTEGTVTITEFLTAGGGTLRANLILKGKEGHVVLDLALGQSGMSALTLGSQFGIDEGTLVTLDSHTISKLEGLSVGGSLQLINAAQGTVLTYGDNYNDMWFGQLFERTEEVQGDYRVYATETGFGLTKVSNVPEPTTGTLSLLALAALAARRRKR